MINFKVQILITVIAALTFLGCGQSEGENDKNSSGEVDQVKIITNMIKAASPIYMKETNSTSLAPSINLSSCMTDDRFNNLGIFGGLWRYSCAISNSVGETLFGKVDPYKYGGKTEAPVESSEDPESGGSSNESNLRLADLENPCDKIVTEDKTSFFGIMCQLPKESIVDAAMAVSEESSTDLAAAVGISFKEVENLNSHGSFNIDAPVLPIGSRIWEGGAVDTLVKSYSVEFEDENNGSIGIAHSSYQAHLDFRHADKDEDCKETLKQEDCHENEFTFYGGETGYINKGMWFKILANDKKDPTLTVVEGTWVLTEMQAKKLMSIDGGVSGNSLFEKGIFVYFRLINVDNTVWGQYIIRDKNGDIIEGEGTGAGQGPILAQESGHCMDFETQPSPDQLFSFQDCGDTDFLAIASALTGGEDNAKKIEDDLPIHALDFSDIPEEGVRTN